MTKPPIPFVQLNAFVMPVHDYDMGYGEGVKYEATSTRNAQEYRVYARSLRERQWSCVERFSEGQLGQAEAAARAWHEMVLAQTGSAEQQELISNERLQYAAAYDRSEDEAMEKNEN